MHNARKVKPTGIELVDRLVAVNRVTKVNKGGEAPRTSNAVSG